MSDDRCHGDAFDRRAGKAPEDDHPLDQPTAADPSDYADPRVAQPGEDPADEDALGPTPEDR
jgi:hypothetical protein